MSNNDSQNSFQERLARLNANQPNPKPEISEPKPKLDSPDFSKPKISFFRQFLVWGFVITLLLLGGAYLLNSAMPGVFSPMIASLDSGFGDSGSSDNSAPKQAVKNTPAPIVAAVTQSAEGAIYGPRTVLSFAGADSVVGDYLFRSDAAQDDPNPAMTTEFDFNATCDVRKPKEIETVMGVRLAGAGQISNVAAIDRRQIATKLLSGLTLSTEHRRPIRLGETEEATLKYTQLGQFSGTMRVVDVLLTDRSKPLYLVLQTRGGQIIWNLHLAPGVKLAHVAMISEGKVGISGLPDGATYEALRISDFVPRHFFGADDEPRDCMIRPWRKPQPNWIAWQNAQKGPGLQANRIETFTKGHAAFDQWYQGAFGVSASANTVTADSADHVLLGPMPGEKFLYRPIAGNDLVVIKSDYLIYGDKAARKERITQLHSELMQAALGGDLDTLWPVAMTGESQ